MRRISPFGALWASQGLSNIADGVNFVIVPLLIARLTRDPLIVAGVIAASTLPWLLFSLHSGVVVDRFDRRSLLFVGNFFRAAAWFIVAGAILGSVEHWAILYLAVFMSTTAEVITDNAAQAIPPRIVPREQLGKAAGRLMTTQSAVDTFVGPPLGAAVFSVSATLAFYTSFGLYALGAGFALLLPSLRPQTTRETKTDSAPSTVSKEIAEGWRYFWQHPVLRRLGLNASMSNVAMAVLEGLLVLYVLEVLNLSEARFALFIAIPAASAILGGVVADRLIDNIGAGPLVGLIGFSVAGGCALLGLTADPLLALASLSLISFIVTTSVVATIITRQMIVPDEMLGRVVGSSRLLNMGPISVAALGAGVLARYVGVQHTILIGGGFALAAAIMFASKLSNANIRAAIEEADRQAFTVDVQPLEELPADGDIEPAIVIP